MWTINFGKRIKFKSPSPLPSTSFRFDLNCAIEFWIGKSHCRALYGLMILAAVGSCSHSDSRAYYSISLGSDDTFGERLIMKGLSLDLLTTERRTFQILCSSIVLGVRRPQYLIWFWKTKIFLSLSILSLIRRHLHFAYTYNAKMKNISKIFLNNK